MIPSLQADGDLVSAVDFSTQYLVTGHEVIHSSFFRFCWSLLQKCQFMKQTPTNPRFPLHTDYLPVLLRWGLTATRGDSNPHFDFCATIFFRIPMVSFENIPKGDWIPQSVRRILTLAYGSYPMGLERTLWPGTTEESLGSHYKETWQPHPLMTPWYGFDCCQNVCVCVNIDQGPMKKKSQFQVRLWDVEAGTCLLTFTEPENFVRCVAFQGQVHLLLC